MTAGNSQLWMHAVILSLTEVRGITSCESLMRRSSSLCRLRPTSSFTARKSAKSRHCRPRASWHWKSMRMFCAGAAGLALASVAFALEKGVVHLDRARTATENR